MCTKCSVQLVHSSVVVFFVFCLLVSHLQAMGHKASTYQVITNPTDCNVDILSVVINNY